MAAQVAPIFVYRHKGFTCFFYYLTIKIINHLIHQNMSFVYPNQKLSSKYTTVNGVNSF